MGQIISIGINHFTFFSFLFIKRVHCWYNFFSVTLSSFTGNNGKPCFFFKWKYLQTDGHLKNTYKYLDLTASASNCSFLVTIFTKIGAQIPLKQRDWKSQIARVLWENNRSYIKYRKTFYFHFWINLAFHFNISPYSI